MNLDKTEPQLLQVDLEGKETSRLKKVLIVLAGLAGVLLVAGIVTGNFQPLAFLVAVAAVVATSWMWSVVVDRAYHRFRQWSRRHAPQPVSVERRASAKTGVKRPLRTVLSGPASLSMEGLLATDSVPLVSASRSSQNPAERVAALRMEAADGLGRLARALEDAGRTKEAEAIWPEALAYDPLNADAGARVQTTSPERAGDDLSRALDLVRSRRYAEAESALQGLAGKGAPGAVLYGLGICHGAQGRPEKAAKLFQQAAEAGAESAGLRLALGAALVEEGEVEKAVKQLRASVTMNPDSAAAQAALGESLIALGDLTGAREALEDGQSINSGHPLVRSAMGRLLYELGDAVGAAREFSAAAEADSGNRDLLFNQAAALAAAGRFDEVIQRLEPAVGEVEDAEIAHMLAEAYEKKGKSAEAQRYLAKSADLMPQGEDARLKLVASLREEGNLAEARAQAETLVAANPRSARGLTELGLVAEAEGDTEQALQHFRSAAQMDRNCALALTSAGRLLFAEGQVRDAVTMLKQAVGLSDATEDTRYWYGEAQLRAGKPLLAIDALQAAARQSGNRRGDISYALGRALLESGRAKEAAEELRRSRKLLPESAPVERDLGYALYKTRNYQDAQRSFRSYLQTAPDAKDAAEIRKLLESLA